MEIVYVVLSLLAVLVCVPGAIVSCIYLKRLWDRRKYTGKESESDPPESNEDDPSTEDRAS